MLYKYFGSILLELACNPYGDTSICLYLAAMTTVNGHIKYTMWIFFNYPKWVRKSGIFGLGV